jgi:O-antigen/teichoic acid export membrane protein
MKILKSFSLYTAASFIEKGLAFFLLPIFTFYLTKGDFGNLALLTSISSFILPLVALGIQGAISVAYFKGEQKNYSSYLTSALIPPFGIAVVLTLVTIIFGSYVEFFFRVPLFWIISIPFYCFLSFFNSLLLIDYQIKNEAGKYVAYSLFGTLVNFLISLLLVIVFHYGYQGRLIGQYLSAFIVSIIAFYTMWRKRKLLVNNVKWDNVKDSLWFGLPLVSHVFGTMVINMSDRMFIDHFYGKDVLGVYNVGYVVGSTISIFTGAFASAIIPFSYELFSMNTHKALVKVVKVYWVFIALMVFTALGVLLFTPFVFKHFLDAKFSEGAEYVTWIVFGFFFQGMYLLFANIIFYLKKTKVLFYMSFVNILLNLGLNYVLVPKFGPIGAAYTICINYFVFFVSIAVYSDTLLRLPWLSVIYKKN